MTVDKLKKLLSYDEPSFGYNGKEYSICSPDGKFYVLSEDNPKDKDLSFQNVDDLLDNWMIQGHPFREIIPNIDLS